MPDSAASLLGFDDRDKGLPARLARYRPSHWSRRRFLVAAGSVLAALTILALSFYSFHQSPPPLTLVDEYLPPAHSNRLDALVGPPTQKFRDNLRNDTQYMSSFISAGWTNDVMTYGNLIYLAMITQRVPIIGNFTPSHIGGDAGTVPFSEVFDIDYLSKAIGSPVLEWSDVKDPTSEEIDDLGCWSVWQAVQTRESEPRFTNALELYGLDISYTAGPLSLQKIPGYEHDPHAHFWSIAALTYPSGREAALQPPQPSKVHGALLPPDEQLACFDYLYYVCAHQSFEYEYDLSPAWRFVVKNFRFTSRLQSIAEGYLKRMFGVPEDGPVPPYVAIHARRANDFSVYCGDVPRADCFPTMNVYARRIAEVQEDTRARLGVVPEHVIMLSDERDPGFWDAVRTMGWYTPDHTAEDTVANYGRWYPLLIDAVIQASGLGLVGTDRSTMSLLAGRRVQDWNGGVYLNVKWGTPHADDH
ncbi:hypothetical protein BV25DRAFT_1793181 [Artomyces pyxidatus]|uniref:Uncharacterized protein n=1 Tax=Artomyces pyxidatus TaxID=48021 RepID=A0ACB8TI69_9AGAM|nr:hypothetical protein BV25DRAFT_1793181 [Artomyces pyxidatus]